MAVPIHMHELPVVVTPVQFLDFGAFLNTATHRCNPICTCFPKHARPFAGIAERINQSLYHLVGLLFPLRKEGMENRFAQREALDTLGCPVCGNILAIHAPDLFSVCLEKDPEE